MSTFTGIGPLFRVAVRQELRRFLPWVLLVAVLSLSSVLAFSWVYEDEASRAQLAATVGANPAMALIFGVPHDLQTADGFNAWRSGALGAFFTGLMTLFIVVRNSRADEDSGQAELLASGVMGRDARLAVALLIAAVASAITAAATWVVTVPAGGGAQATLLLAATFAASGLMFAGVGAIAAQLASEARTANTIGITALGALYLARGYIDASGFDEWTAWLTPFGWLERTQPAVQNNPWPLLLALAFTAVLAVVAFVLQGRRDFGQGSIPPRPGPARAWLARTLWGFTLRLHGATVVSWLVAFVLLGAVFGTLSTSIGDIITDNPLVGQIIAAGGATEADLLFEFLLTILKVLGLIAAIVGVQVLLRVYTEETAYRVEPLLAGAVRRRSYLAGVTTLAMALPTVGLLIAGSLIGLIASTADDDIAAAEVLMQTIALLPAVWVLIALALAAVGALPAVRAVGWVGIVVAFALTILGPLFDLPDAVLGINPLWHVPNITASDPHWTGLIVVGVVTALLAVIGFVGYRRRDIA